MVKYRKISLPISITRTLLCGCVSLMLYAMPAVSFSQSSILDKYRDSTSSSSSSSGTSATDGTGSSGEGADGAADDFREENEGAGSLQGDERFVRDARDASAFVGADTEDASNARSIQEGD